MPNKDAKIGALWARTTKNGTPYYSGEIDGQRVVIFPNGYRQTDKHPDFIVYKDQPRVAKAQKPDDDSDGVPF